MNTLMFVQMSLLCYLLIIVYVFEAIHNETEIISKMNEICSFFGIRFSMQ